jgi:AcrR family transcriptional regulator
VSPRPRFESLPDERRRAILQAAAAEFAERGFEAASYNRIIAESGVSKGAMYYYFDDKRDLYLTTLHGALQQAEEAIGALAPFDDAESFWRALGDFYRRITAFFGSQPDVAGLIKSAYVGGATAGEAYSEFMGLASKRFEEVLARGVAVGAVRADLPLDLLLDVCIASAEAADRWALSRLDQIAAQGPPALEAVADRLLDLHLRMAAPLSLVVERESTRQERAGED